MARARESICDLQFPICDWGTGLEIENRKSKIENGLNLRLGDEDICDLKSRWVRVPKSKIANLKAQMGEIENGLPIDIPAVADPDQMNDSVLRIDFVDHPVVAMSEGITALFLSL